MKFRVSTERDVVALKTVWKLAFHDEGPYVENFFQNYGSPSRIYVAETEGQVVAMTVWFGSTLYREEKKFPFAYLYAVATRPDYEKQGIAGKLLLYVYEEMVKLGFVGVTTVPATTSLHRFFQKNGFEEYFVQQEWTMVWKADVRNEDKPEQETHQRNIVPLSAEDYGTVRNALWSQEEWSKVPVVSLDVAGFSYQQSVGLIGGVETGGGLFYYGQPSFLQQCLENRQEVQSIKESEPIGGCVFAIEPYGANQVMVKEWIGVEDVMVEEAMQCWGETYGVAEGCGLTLRCPVVSSETARGDVVEFGMIQWLTSCPENWKSCDKEQGFLGFAFD